MRVICLKCRATLTRKTHTLFCNKCKTKYPIRDGIPSFCEDHYYGEISKKELKKIIKKGRKVGFKRTLTTYIRKKFPAFHKYISHETRIAPAFLLTPKVYQNVLDLGCGYGSISIELAKIFKCVVAIDITFEKLKMLKSRIEEEKIKNIQLIHADALRLPFPEKSFDAIVIIGLLEWIPLSEKSKNPEKVQGDFLQKMYKLLRDGGEILIGIENRFGFQYFLGWKDHNGIWGTNLLPRKLANFYSKLRLGEEYRTYTHSINSYKKLLKDVGFESVEFFAALRSYRYPRYIIPLKNNNLKIFFQNIFIPTSKIQEFASSIVKLVPSHVLSYFSPHFFIKGIKPGKDYEKKLQRKSLPSNYIIRKGNATVFIPLNKGYVVKIFDNKKIAEGLKNYIKFYRLNNGIKKIGPKPISLKRKGNYWIYTEEYVKGKRLIPTVKLFPLISKKLINILSSLTVSKKKVIRHNDLGYGNIIISDGTLKIIDWSSCRLGYPLLDYLSFTQSYYSFLIQQGKLENVVKKSFIKEVVNFSQNYLEKIGTSYKLEKLIKIFEKLVYQNEELDALGFIRDLKCLR